MSGDLVPRLTLRHGAMMPSFGLGTGGRKLSNAAAPTVVRQAIEAGYRMIDTAERYENEEGVGQGIRESGIAREEVFITTKFNAEWHGVELAREAFEASAARLKVDYIDLLMIHWPNPSQDRYVQAWEGLIGLLQDKKVLAIGMSNFKPAHLDRVIGTTGIVPDVNQIQLDPMVIQEEARSYHRAHGIVTQAWAPLGKAGPLLAEPAILRIAVQHRRTPAQVVLRWHVELGVVPQPGTLNRKHMAENLSIFDFRLTEEEVTEISSLDGRHPDVIDSDLFGH